MPDRRRFLRGAAAAGLGVLAGCIQLEVPDPGEEPGNADDEPPEDDPEGDDPDREDPSDRVQAFERAIHERVNEVREEEGREPLEYHDGIAAVARAHSDDMDDRDYFSHSSPEGEGPGDRLTEFYPGYCRSIGENLANVWIRDGESPEAVSDRVVTGWMNSSGHRRNVLNDGFDEQGIGVAVTEEGRVLATQKFCARPDHES